MPRIFLAYRRSDSAFHQTGRLSDLLADQFGAEHVFRDICSIPLGMDLRAVIERAIQDSDVMLVIIGKSWLEVCDEDGHRRLDQPSDFVRLEIQIALSSDVRVIPVLVDGVEMPTEIELPESLRELAYRHPFVLSDHSFESDCLRLVDAIRGYVAPSPLACAAPRWKLWLLEKFARMLDIPNQPSEAIETSKEAKELATSGAKAKWHTKKNTPTQDEVFLSYARDDTLIMQNVRDYLAANDITVWTDEKLEPGTRSWQKAIQVAIERSNCFVVLMTSNSKQSEVIEMERGYALAQDRLMFPVLAGGTKRTAVPFDLINRQWTDIREDFDFGMSKLVKAVVELRGDQISRMAMEK